MLASHRRPTYVLSSLIALLMGITAAGGLFLPSLYRDNATTAAALRGNDLITLVLATPILIVTLLVVRRRQNPSPRVLLVWMAMLVYSLYNYTFYLFGSAINNFFLLYIILTVLSIWGLISGLSGLDTQRIARAFRPRTPTRWIAGFMVFFALFLGGLWVARVIGFMLSGIVPQDIIQTGNPTGIVYAIDLTLLIPTLLVGAIWLWQRRAWGYVLATIMMVKCTTYALALIAMSPFAEAAGQANAWELVPLWAGLGVGTLLATFGLLGNLGPWPAGKKGRR